MITGVPESPDVLDTTSPFVPVTRPKSLARSPPARVTPAQSLLSIKIVGPEPVPPNFSPPTVSEKVMLAGWPMAWVPTRNNVQHAMNERRFIIVMRLEQGVFFFFDPILWIIFTFCMFEYGPRMEIMSCGQYSAIWQ